MGTRTISEKAYSLENGYCFYHEIGRDAVGMGIPIPNPHTHEYGYGDLKSSQHCYGSPGSRRPESKRTTLRPPPVANSWLRNCSRQIVRLLETTEIAQNVPNYRPRLFEAARRCSRSHMCDGQRSKHEEVKLCALRMRSQARHA